MLSLCFYWQKVIGQGISSLFMQPKKISGNEQQIFQSNKKGLSLGLESGVKKNIKIFSSSFCILLPFQPFEVCHTMENKRDGDH